MEVYMEEAMKLMTKFINSGLDPMFFIKESFLGYKYRKSKKIDTLRIYIL